MSTIRGQLADGECQTVGCSYRLDLCSETELRIQVMELLFDDAYLSNGIDDKKSWFTQMELHDLIDHQFFFTSKSLGRQPTTSQYLQPLTQQTLALAAVTIHCARSEYASGKKAIVMFCQDDYRGTFCPSPVINARLEATTLIRHTIAGRVIPPAAQLHYETPSSIPISTLQPRSTLFCSSQHSIAHSTLVNCLWCTSVSIVTHIMNSACLTPPPVSTHLRWYGCSSIPVGAPQPRFGSLFHSVLLHHLLCTPHFHTALPILALLCSWWLLPFSIWIIIAFQTLI